jgi:GNAT superfamily N-acetyltransferase
MDGGKFFEAHKGEYLISTEPARLDLDRICYFLSRSYWAGDRPREVTAKALRNSLCFGLYHGGEQVGLARVVTDRATFAWLCDVWVDKAHRGRGLGKWLVACVVAHPELCDLHLFILATRDAHELYARYGRFDRVTSPDKIMVRRGY